MHMKIHLVAGARPNFMKIAPLYRAMLAYPDMQPQIVHTGQHYDFAMSGIFFRQLDIPKPHYFLNIRPGSPSTQTAGIMLAFEKIVQAERPDCVLVVGDVTSTLACALVAAQAQVPLVHVEAGLRSRDRTMPEEMNRMLTDAISDELFVTEQAAVDNLLAERLDPARIHYVGNVMIDSLVHCREHMGEPPGDLEAGRYLLVPMHRPANVDHEHGLRKIAAMMEMLGAYRQIVFVMHPRTARNLAALGMDLGGLANVRMLPPQGYIEFITLLRHAAAVITDSGGVQEETTFLGVPCITLRNSTERPVTLTSGTNYLMPDFDARSVLRKLNEILSAGAGNATVPPLWDGHAAERIMNILREKYINS